MGISVIVYLIFCIFIMDAITFFSLLCNLIWILLSVMVHVLALKTSYLENVTGTFPTQIMLARKDYHWLGKHFQTYWTYKLLLQVIHSLLFFTQGLVSQRGAHLLAISRRVISGEIDCGDEFPGLFSSNNSWTRVIKYPMSFLSWVTLFKGSFEKCSSCF